MSNDFEKKGISINNSLLVDEEKILNIVVQIARERNTIYFAYPTSFDEISKDILDKMKYIDKCYQDNIISKEIAMEMFADLLITDGIKKRYNEYVEDVNLRKIKELRELIDDKHQSLLSEFSNGRIDEFEFYKSLQDLKILESNSMNEFEPADNLSRKK